MPIENFESALRAAYAETPCAVLPNPLWRTLRHLADFTTAYSQREGQVNALEAQNAEGLYIYWTRTDRRSGYLMRRKLDDTRFAIVHQDYLEPDVVAGFVGRQARFRLLHTAEVAPALPDGLSWADADPAQAEAIAAFIARCDPTFQPTAETVRTWAGESACAPDLWLWAQDAQGEPVGLAYAERDAALPEAALEGAYVRPDWRKRGLGRALVGEVVRRAKASGTALVTVAGAVEDRDNPGAFFRRCGFSGRDVWWYLSR